MKHTDTTFRYGSLTRRKQCMDDVFYLPDVPTSVFYACLYLHFFDTRQPIKNTQLIIFNPELPEAAIWHVSATLVKLD